MRIRLAALTPLLTRTLAVSQPGLFVSPLILRDIRGRCEFALASDPFAVEVEEDGHGDCDEGDAAEELVVKVSTCWCLCNRDMDRIGVMYRCCPLDAHAIEHVCGEEREYAPEKRSHECIRCYSGSSEHQIGVYDVVE